MSFRRSILALMILLGISPLTALAAEPQWIWRTKEAAAKAEPGVCYFRKTFSVEQPESAVVEITADNAFELFVNGRRVGRGDSWSQRFRFDISPLLLPGRNVIAVAADNGGPDPAGLAAKVVVKGKGGQPAEHSTDATWKFNLKPPGTWARIESDDSQWAAAIPLGEYGKTAPWGAAGPLAEGKPDAILNQPRVVEKGQFEFRDGDRVVFLGSAFIERLQNSGCLETLLTIAQPGKNITFRNLGWSGDTVWGDARAVFGGRADGFKRLLSDLAICNPTVLIVCYGENEAFAGEAGLAEFETGLNTLLDSLEATGARIVLLGPRQHEKLPPPLPDPAKYNADLRKYNDLIAETAQQRQHTFLDLYAAGISPEKSSSSAASQPFTDNGIHLNRLGDQVMSSFIASRLGPPLFSPTLTLDYASHSYDAAGLFIHELEWKADAAALTISARTLPSPAQFTGTSSSPPAADVGEVRARGLPPGEYAWRVNGEAIKTASAQAWGQGLGSLNLSSTDQARQLQQLVNEKNMLFFHRYRPQNETYLFLFRKHEQGNNAVEIPQFDPLIQALEKKIADLRTPPKQKYELVKTK